MFTGIIEEIGDVLAVAPSGEGVRLTIHAPLAVLDAEQGQSIAVNGVCLTVVDQDEVSFEADVMAETLAVSTIGDLKVGDPVNVERALRADGRLDGHIVQGHVDGTGEVLEVRPGDKWSVVRISLPEPLAPLVAKKGSIAVDGVSLTVSDVGRDWFEVSLIPETLTATTLGSLEPGMRVNLETDVVARHLARLAEFTRGGD